MADRRGVRSASRRKTPTPQPPSKVNTPQAGRATRTRGVRSASRDVEMVEVQKPTRRSARQASVTTLTDESDHETQATRRTRRRMPAKEAVADLTVVEEVDTQIEPDEAPNTPKRTQTEDPAFFRSPGAASEMSGTTAISSFSMVESEFLDSRKILKHLRKLCESATEFLEHVAPDNGSLEDDLRHIHEIQKPDSDFTDEYRDFNEELELHLKHYKSEEHNYIRVRAVHRALFESNHDLAAAASGIDLILYLANLLVFAKQMIHSDRSEKEIWDALRQLDNSFPSQFMRALNAGAEPTNAGESALLQDTFNLALELRTQLAILVLERSTADSDLNPDEAIIEVFLRSEPSQESAGSMIRGWSIAALGGDDSALPQQFQHFVVERLNKMREFFPVNEQSLESGDLIDLEGLGASFPWEATILRLLHWVRLRHRELRQSIDGLGGGAAILRSVQRQIEEPQSASQLRTTSAPQETPRRKRKSFSERRRASRKFDPNAAVDSRTIDALKARERLSEAGAVLIAQVAQAAEPEAIEEVQDGLLVVEQQQDQHQPIVGDDEVDQLVEQAVEDPIELEATAKPLEEEEQEEDQEVPEAEPAGPPTSSAAILKALKKVSKVEKENRLTSIFDRHANAQRVEFGDGFDTQATPGPSTGNKGKQPAQSSPKRKRPRAFDISSDSDDDAFEAEDRTARAQERRAKAPVTKKVRIDPTSSAAPPSHQPPPQPTDESLFIPEAEEESVSEAVSEAEGPDMTEAAPPSTYQEQLKLAKENRNILGPRDRRNDRKPRTDWTSAAENAFAEYMGKFPCKYSAIKKYDEEEGYALLLDRTQVNLKDKARTMAINMIKSGTGLMNGFEEVIKYHTNDGKRLMAAGYEW
ncbi:hypothetical protein FB567DRAFT_337772 [Paraphoma chrysanthemicola]|uniref:Myb-like domain-containing protein n=1 Tax=Paraphoma chrysanthemicola TaxID=798071 RepID=A0A8K0RAA5_9PLEO|nr:hypothetical protein FB567DRAFT_337772 [Paraphoma chrysanthemicola]